MQPRVYSPHCKRSDAPRARRGRAVGATPLRTEGDPQWDNTTTLSASKPKRVSTLTGWTRVSRKASQPSQHAQRDGRTRLRPRRQYAGRLFAVAADWPLGREARPG